MDDKTPWWIVYTSGLTPLGLAIWTVYVFVTRRKDDSAGRAQTIQDSREIRLAAENRALYDTLKERLTACEHDLDQTADDRNHGWDLARRWQDDTWIERQERRNDRQLVDSHIRRMERLLEKAGIAPPDPPFSWSEMRPLPDKLERG